MGILYDTVKLSKESERQILIDELLTLGITEFKGENVNSLDYYTLVHALSVARICIESDENKWF